MKKVLRIAIHEFLATVATKGFIIGILITPLIIMVMAVVFPRILSDDAPRVVGELALLDPSGEVAPGVQAELAPEAIALRRDDFQEAIDESTPESMKKMPGMAASTAATQGALASILGQIPQITVVPLAADAALDDVKAQLLIEPQDNGHDGLLAIAVVHPDAIRRPSETADFGTYDLYVREKLDDRIEDEIKTAMRRSIVDARIRAAALDPERVGALTRIGRVRSTTVTADGERETNEALNALLPAGFMILLLISVLTSGQHIMTNTIEEKSSRVIEVLLSAVSPMELMTGKIVGQMCVGLVVLGIYSGMGISALVTFALLGLVDLSLFVYLFFFYLIAYFIIAAAMAAIGSAVNELREAQSLMTPVMLVVMIPWLMWLPITRDPNSLFATVTSFIPPLSSFVMLLRMTSTAPPPSWQVWLSIAVGAVGVYFALWFAAKVFRIGLLLHGKPPSFATLVKWMRMA